MRTAAITIVLALSVWALAHEALKYRWEYSCITDDDCEYEDSVRAKAMGEPQPEF